MTLGKLLYPINGGIKNADFYLTSLHLNSDIFT